MSFLSLFLKTFALALFGTRPWVALVLWLASAALDFTAARGPGGGRPDRALWTRLAVWQGVCLLLGWVAAAACDYGAMRWKDGIPALAAPVSGLLSVCGLGCGSRDGVVFVTTMAGPLEFAASIDSLALKVPVVFLALALARLLWTGHTLPETARRWGAMAALVGAATLVRFAFYIFLAVSLCDFTGYETEEMPYRPFMDETARALFHIPFLLACGVLLGRLLAAPAVADPRAAALPPRRLWWAAVPGALALATVVFWHPAGTPKQEKKIVIANWHAQWSPSDIPYDREWYGADSGYNYACLARLFGLFAPVQLTAGPLTAADLAGASTLVVYDPDRRFSKDQLALIHDFVREGGGLLVIGDHTNVFGGTTHLNELCAPFGFQLRDDVLFDLDEDFHQMLYPPPLANSLWHGMGMFKLRGPASIRPTSIWTRPVYHVDHSKSVRAIYSVNNFFPPPHDHPRMKSGDFCVAATARYGRGRVIAWGDSTVFSNFEIFYPGKYEFLLNAAHWLNHRDSSLSALVRTLALVCLGVGALALVIRWPRPAVVLGTLVLLAGAGTGGWLIGRAAEHSRGAFPEPLGASDWLVFAADPADPIHNLTGFVAEGPYDQRYEVFIQWVLRTGAMSGFHVLGDHRGNALYQHLRDAGKARVARALIVRKPKDLAQLDDLAAIPSAKSDPLLLMFASSIRAEDAVAAVKRSGLLGTDSAANSIVSAWPAGETLVEEGGRRALIVASAERFADQAMGISEKVTPNAAQRALFDQAFGVIDRLFNRVPPPAPSVQPSPQEPPSPPTPAIQPPSP
ncbi:MAG: DUF4350 domain-containing protein [Akkermansiaceae bacterium]|nr:DUF4350 domain-containing protein [Akkermansiaceae bacterium]